MPQSDPEKYKAYQKKYNKEVWYPKHRKAHIATVAKNNKRYSLMCHEFLVDYLRLHPCVDCKESDIRTLDFDHMRGEKLFNVSKMIGKHSTLDPLKAEIEKCDVRCANCHRKKTNVTLGWYRGGVAQLESAVVS